MLSWTHYIFIILSIKVPTRPVRRNRSEDHRIKQIWFPEASIVTQLIHFSNSHNLDCNLWYVRNALSLKHSYILDMSWMKAFDSSLIHLFVYAVVCVVALCITLTQAIDALSRMEAWSLVLVIIFALILLIIVFLIWRHPQNPTKASFMVRIWNGSIFGSISNDRESDKYFTSPFISHFIGAFPPCSAFIEHTHQCLPDGAVRRRHLVEIWYLDVSR